MTKQDIAEHLLWPIWRGVPDAYKVRYARTIWQQFEDNIRSAAYTSSPVYFFECLCRKLNVQITLADARSVADTLATEDPRSLLKSLRDETTYLVLLCRLKNQDRKDERHGGQDLSVSGQGNGAQLDIA